MDRALTIYAPTVSHLIDTLVAIDKEHRSSHPHMRWYGFDDESIIVYDIDTGDNIAYIEPSMI